MKQKKQHTKTCARIACAAMVLLCSTALTACQTTTTSPQTESQQTEAIDNALRQAAFQAAVQGDKQKSLAFVERLYRRNSHDPKLAMLYGQALRKEDRLTRAALVIQPHLMAPDTPADFKAPLFTEYAAILSAMGDYGQAEYYARQAVVMAPELGRPYHILGLALDAQGHHPEAEVALRKAIDRWQGDPTPVLNNLGLNLAAQGFLDKAVETLRKARAAAPNRDEIERNLRIVSALHATPPKDGWSFMPKAVIPMRKPPVAYDKTRVPDPLLTPDEPKDDTSTKSEKKADKEESAKAKSKDKKDVSAKKEAEEPKESKTKVALPTKKPVNPKTSAKSAPQSLKKRPVGEKDVAKVPAIKPGEVSTEKAKAKPVQRKARSFND